MAALKVPLVDLRIQYQNLKPEIMAAFAEVLEDMQLFLGPRTRAFEQQFAEYCACHCGVGVSSGTDALVLALRACDIGPGDEVITVSNTFIATIEAIALVGARPVFVDVDPVTYLMDWRQLDVVLTEHTKAILPVHLYGHAAEMGPIMEFARAHHLRVIEDASQAHGATYNGQRVGSFGDVGCFSLYYSKNLGAFGEAGICTTNDEALAERLRMIRDHGSRVRYHHEVIGGNYRLDEMQSAVLLLKMPYLEQWNKARQQHASFYTEQLSAFVAQVPRIKSWATHVFCYYVIQVEQRDAFRKALEAQGIGTNVHYPIPLHLQPACADYGYTRGMLPVTEAVSERIVSLPMYPELTLDQLELVATTVKKALLAGAR